MVHVKVKYCQSGIWEICGIHYLAIVLKENSDENWKKIYVRDFQTVQFDSQGQKFGQVGGAFQSCVFKEITKKQT